jgi:small subunit ribosomal protein S1
LEIILAKTAGFCFGVDKAISQTFDLLSKPHEHIYTVGPIIHNEQVVNTLKAKGVKVCDDIKEITGHASAVIRAHGVTPEVYNQLSQKGIEIIDATCPYVKKIHKLVKEKYDEGYQIIIVGDKNHPEVKGINGWCKDTAYIVNSIEDAENISENSEKLCVVAQTTITREKWVIITEFLKKTFKNIIKFDTICNATNKRQSEAEEISKTVNMMIVIGGNNSSNTQKLYEICSRNCPITFKIQTADELPAFDINKIKKTGITAGASTPDWIIKEVIERMSDLNNMDSEVNFKEAFESSIITLKTGQVVKGKIVGYNSAEVYVDMGFKADGIIPIDQFTDDPDFKPEKELKIGDEIEVFVIRVNDGEGNVLLSKKKVDTIKSWDSVEESYKNKTPISVKVTDVVNGGVIASAKGVRIFIPASQISDRYTKDLNEFLKKTLNVRIVEYNKQKRKLVGSARIILEEDKSRIQDEVWSTLEVGKKFTGTVKNLMDFGAFVDIGGVDGLIHISELSWNKIKHPSEILKVGDTVEVSIKEFDREKNRISLGFKKAEDNPWYNAEQKYQVGNVVKGKVVRIVPFGAFIELGDGIDGLVHISQISNARIAKPGDVLEVGQEVEAQIIEVNIDTKKIGLSIKALNPMDPVKDQDNENKSADNSEITPSEHKEEMNNTIGDLVSDLSEDANNSGDE